MRMRGLFLVIACVLIAAPAAAASFDCAKAETPVEKAICVNKDLSTADVDMARAFAAARKKLSKPASAVVLDNQRRWIDFVARACTNDAEPMARGTYDEDGIYCLTTLFSNRAEALKTIGAVGGLTVYPVDAFGAMPDPDPDAWNKVATTTISYAQIDGAGDEVAAFNRFARSLAEPALDAPPDPEIDGTTDTDVSIWVTEVSPQRISLSINSYFYGHGAAHGNYAIAYAQYLRREGRPMAAGDVFAGANWAVELKPLIIARLKEDAVANLDDAEAIWDDLTGLEDSIADPSRWDVQDTGIAFQFQPYEVSAYAYGAPQALMSWEELSPWLQPGAMALLVGE